MIRPALAPLALIALAWVVGAVGCGGDEDTKKKSPTPPAGDAGVEGGPACPPSAEGKVAGDACEHTNTFGTCPGVLVCVGGAVECTGQTPQAEQCNGVDDECDGEVDEDFKDADGRFVTDEHCGVCGNACATAYSNAATVSCDDTKPTPGCVIEECAAGFVRASETLCLPEQSVLCQPCVVDADCISSPGAVCVTLPDPDRPGSTVNVCAQDCSSGAALGACPTGFSCRSGGGEGGMAFTEQCIPDSGSCSCDAQPDGTQIFCTAVGVNEITGEPISCNGTRTCTGGTPGACVLPSDDCDGIDNDCNGRIDDAFRDAVTGRYDQDDAHCGVCGNSCAASTFANAQSVCLGGSGAPRCGPTCNGGFFDADGDEANGCECQFTSATDLPDPAGTDANCDGIDGELGAAYFVAPTGSDTNPGTRELPFRTVQKGLDQARLDAKRDVLVAQGVYAENVTLPDGVASYGGYSQDFATRDSAQFEAVIFGQPLQSGQRGAVTVTGITTGATLDGFTVFGANAPGVGQSSYAISIVDSTSALVVANNRVVGGLGGPGASGSRGSDGADGAMGTAGLDGIATDRDCTLAPRAGGAAGATTCEGVPTNGGRGGDASCPQTQRITGTGACLITQPTQCRNTYAGPPAIAPPAPPPQGAGEPGLNGGAAGGTPTYDRWTAFDTTDDCNFCGLQEGWPHIGVAGTSGGDGGDGAPGGGCSQPDGTATATGFTARPGGSGAIGTHGGGAGGGSAGSGFDIVPTASGGSCTSGDRIGGSGGGGGSGGCRGQAGIAGGGGGGSFGIWVGFTTTVASAPTITGNSVSVGVGGRGGQGGAGGSGGLGGRGASGGVAESAIVFCAEPGGRGGNGGRGGHGGGGGGGCGGVAFGIALFAGPNSFTPDYAAPNTFSGGAGGMGGPGGVSLGSSGTSGADGTTANTIRF